MQTEGKPLQLFYIRSNLNFHWLNKQQIVDIAYFSLNKCAVLYKYQCITFCLLENQKETEESAHKIQLAQEGISVYPFKNGICILTAKNYYLIYQDKNTVIPNRQKNAEIMLFNQTSELFEIYLDTQFRRRIRNIANPNLFYETRTNNYYDQADDYQSIVVERTDKQITVFNFLKRQTTRLKLPFKNPLLGFYLLSKIQALCIIRKKYGNGQNLVLVNFEKGQKPGNFQVLKNIQISPHAWLICVNKSCHRAVINCTNQILIYDYKNENIVCKLKNKFGFSSKSISKNFDNIVLFKNEQCDIIQFAYLIHYKAVNVKKILMHLYKNGGYQQIFKGDELLRMVLKVSQLIL